jgi:hypothetical protein
MLETISYVHAALVSSVCFHIGISSVSFLLALLLGQLSTLKVD